MRTALEEEGDPAFWRMLLDRVWPTRTEVEVGAGSEMTFAWMRTEPVEAEVVDEGESD